MWKKQSAIKQLVWCSFTSKETWRRLNLNRKRGACSQRTGWLQSNGAHTEMWCTLRRENPTLADKEKSVFYTVTKNFNHPAFHKHADSREHQRTVQVIDADFFCHVIYVSLYFFILFFFKKKVRKRTSSDPWKKQWFCAPPITVLIGTQFLLLTSRVWGVVLSKRVMISETNRCCWGFQNEMFCSLERHERSAIQFHYIKEKAEIFVADVSKTI